MTWIGRLIALFLAFMVVMTLPFAIWINSTHELIKPENIKEGLARQDIYPDIVPVAVPAIAASVDQGENLIARITTRISPADWRAVANDLVPPDILQFQVENGVDLLFAWLNGDRQALDQTIDVTAFRQRLTGPEGQRAVNRIIDSAPDCTPEEVSQLRAFADGADVLLPICRPTEDIRNIAQQEITRSLSEIAGKMEGDHIPLIRLLGGEESREDLIGLRLGYQSLPELLPLLFMFPLAMCALIVIFAVRSLKSFGIWMGITSIISGIFALLPLLILPLLIIDSISGDLITQSADMDAELHLFLVRLTGGFLQSLFSAFSKPVLGWSALLVVGGFILLGIAAVAPAPAPRIVTIAPDGGVSVTSETPTGRKRRTVSVPDLNAEAARSKAKGIPKVKNDELDNDGPTLIER